MGQGVAVLDGDIPCRGQRRNPGGNLLRVRIGETVCFVEKHRRLCEKRKNSE